jgi:hypothetical protein
MALRKHFACCMLRYFVCAPQVYRFCQVDKNSIQINVMNWSEGARPDTTYQSGIYLVRLLFYRALQKWWKHPVCSIMQVLSE